MRHSRVVLVFTCVVAASALCASPRSDAAAERAVRATLQSWLDALTHNDLPALEAIIADDYVITAGAEGKVMNKQQDLEPLHSGRVKFESAEATDVMVRIFGDTAVVTGIGQFKVIGLPGVIEERFTDVYAKRHGRWQPVASHSTPIKRPR